MEKIKLITDDYTGQINHLRHACRRILIRKGKIILAYEIKENKYIIPGGGVENNETYEVCCEREMLEETGIIVKAKHNYLEIEELFLDWQHINHYFICELIEDTGEKHLTEGEKQAGYENIWIPIETALEIFGNYEEFRKTNIADYGLYRREFSALKAGLRFL